MEPLAATATFAVCFAFGMAVISMLATRIIVGKSLAAELLLLSAFLSLFGAAYNLGIGMFDTENHLFHPMVTYITSSISSVLFLGGALAITGTEVPTRFLAMISAVVALLVLSSLAAEKPQVIAGLADLIINFSASILSFAVFIRHFFVLKADNRSFFTLASVFIFSVFYVYPIAYVTEHMEPFASDPGKPLQIFYILVWSLFYLMNFIGLTMMAVHRLKPKASWA